MKKIPVSRPLLIGIYNQDMGDIDLFDQKTSFYTYNHSSVKWTHIIRNHFLSVATVNTHILYNWNKTAENKIYLLVAFIIVLIHDLVDITVVIDISNDNTSNYDR